MVVVRLTLLCVPAVMWEQRSLPTAHPSALRSLVSFTFMKMLSLLQTLQMLPLHSLVPLIAVGAVSHLCCTTTFPGVAQSSQSSGGSPARSLVGRHCSGRCRRKSHVCNSLKSRSRIPSSDYCGRGSVHQYYPQQFFKGSFPHMLLLMVLMFGILRF